MTVFNFTSNTFNPTIYTNENEKYLFATPHGQVFVNGVVYGERGAYSWDHQTYEPSYLSHDIWGEYVGFVSCC